jgi:hypothetical protein
VTQISGKKTWCPDGQEHVWEALGALPYREKTKSGPAAASDPEPAKLIAVTEYVCKRCGHLIFEKA